MFKFTTQEGREMSRLEELRYQYFINQGVTEEIAKRKAKEQYGKFITLPATKENLCWYFDSLKTEIKASRKLAKVMAKRKSKPLQSQLDWANMLENFLKEEQTRYGNSQLKKEEK